jgi:hypothetical protein
VLAGVAVEEFFEERIDDAQRGGWPTVRGLSTKRSATGPERVEHCRTQLCTVWRDTAKRAAMLVVLSPAPRHNRACARPNRRASRVVRTTS